MDANEIVSTEPLKVPLTLTNSAKKLTYNVTNILFKGEFGPIYTGTQTDDNKSVLIKLLSPNGYQVALEFIKLLQNTNMGGATLFYIQDNSTINETRYPYIVMNGEWCNFGENVGKIKGCIYSGYFLEEALSSIEFLHNRGFYHNNLRPSSFWYLKRNDVNGINEDLVRLADYEFCFKAPNVNGKEVNSDNPELTKIYEKRFKGKPGNLSYCGLNQHTNSKNYMIYDVESVYYIYAEYCEGKLPWSATPNDEKAIIQGKNEMRDPRSEYYNALTLYLCQILLIIDKMNPECIPNYKRIKTILRAQDRCIDYYDPPELTEKFLDDFDKPREMQRAIIEDDICEEKKEPPKVKTPTKKHGVSKDKPAKKEKNGFFASLFKSKPKTKKKT
uniref:Protein kinase domain-containing protein n=1 Tax=Parastrongyloides trichosuri TaxID=131310 RepID=A0A0N4Z9R6_PARTI